MENKEIIAIATARALGVARKNGLRIGQKIAHHSIPEVCILVAVKRQWAVIQLCDEGSRIGTPVEITCLRKDLFDPYLVEKLALRMSEEERSKKPLLSIS